VIVPPFEYDPIRPRTSTEIASQQSATPARSPRGPVNEPLDDQPLDKPFGWALIKLDGADTAMLVRRRRRLDRHDEHRHAGGSAGRRTEREGHINDIECFVPEGD
jgi:hypothetical protein